MKTTRIADILRVHATREQAAGSDTFSALLRESATRLEAGEALVAHLDMLLNGINYGVPIPEDGAAVTAAREAIKAWKGDQ